MPVAVAPPVLTFPVAVTTVRRLSPTFLRVTFGGESLRRFDRGGPLGPRDRRIKLVLSTRGSGLVPTPASGPDWYAEWRAQPPAVRGVLRTYTARRLHGTEDEPLLDIDFVVHGPGRSGHAGPACTFAVNARPGDRITVLGPNAEVEGYGGIEWRPPVATSERPVTVLLAGDETAVPAVCSILETLPPGYRGHAVLEVPGALDFLGVRAPAGVEVTWLARGGRPRGELLLAELARRAAGWGAARPFVGPPDVDVDRELLWETAEPAGRSYAWVAGEAGLVRAVRHLLRAECGMDRRDVAFMGYWREGRAEAS